MGTIAARDCLRVLELTEQVAAASLLAAVQGVELRGEAEPLGMALDGTISEVRQISPFLSADRALDGELRQCLAVIGKQTWQLYG